MLIKLTSSTPDLPFAEDDLLNEEQVQALLAQCPTINLKAVQNKQQITQFLVELFTYYFGLNTNNISPENCLVDNIERQIWAKELDVAFEDVTYAKVFCSKDEEGKTTGGLEDRGMILTTFFMFDFADLIGLHIVNNEEEATLKIDENEFKSYYDCKNINELSTLLFSVCKEYQLLEGT
ncbi:hypothetical protein [Psychromonas sp. Urea-02u-13]|uniref:hypothetical protein n=1 Tax=Psychromonas sp. Urea-02u-13 TaxID=2058326 RepID=UPI000C349AB8|nr:hypothetical protein [Psychromonas sp. Urea-02u-13]PKG38931.1 hypothetical protein CXF74_10800 [Psychromonas sp. Urea-02u-13]